MRVGIGGELFEVIKFRTMVDGTHLEITANSQLRAAYEQNDFKLSPDDPRITRVGGSIRRTSLDELPQLVDILRGEMSLVGVRPLLADELALRSRRDKDLCALRRPGLTGLWQVEGRPAARHVEHLELDRGHLEDRSVLSDLRILSRTPRAVSGAHQLGRFGMADPQDRIPRLVLPTEMISVGAWSLMQILRPPPRRRIGQPPARLGTPAQTR